MNRRKLAMARSMYRAQKYAWGNRHQYWMCRAWATRWLRRMGVFMLLALALCGCQKDPLEDWNMAPPKEPQVTRVETLSESDDNVFGYFDETVNGVRCIKFRGYQSIGLSCDWIGYHQRQPERQPPDVEEVKACINGLDPNSSDLTREILDCAQQ